MVVRAKRRGPLQGPCSLLRRSFGPELGWGRYRVNLKAPMRHASALALVVLPCATGFGHLPAVNSCYREETTDGGATGLDDCVAIKPCGSAEILVYRCWEEHGSPHWVLPGDPHAGSAELLLSMCPGVVDDDMPGADVWYFTDDVYDVNTRAH